MKCTHCRGRVILAADTWRVCPSCEGTKIDRGNIAPPPSPCRNGGDEHWPETPDAGSCPCGAMRIVYSTSAFDAIRDGADDAIAYAKGDSSAGRVTAPPEAPKNEARCDRRHPPPERARREAWVVELASTGRFVEAFATREQALADLVDGDCDHYDLARYVPAAEAERWRDYHDKLAAAWRDETSLLRSMTGRDSEDIGPRRIVRDLTKETEALRAENARLAAERDELLRPAERDMAESLVKVLDERDAARAENARLAADLAEVRRQREAGGDAYDNEAAKAAHYQAEVERLTNLQTETRRDYVTAIARCADHGVGDPSTPLYEHVEDLVAVVRAARAVADPIYAPSEFPDQAALEALINALAALDTGRGGSQP